MLKTTVRRANHALGSLIDRVIQTYGDLASSHHAFV